MDVRAQEKLFKKLFSPKSLFDVYTERFSKSAAKGLDRINGMQYSNRARKELKKVSEKCLNGSFRFTPYLEKLKSKGRGKKPRVISIPTIRDRVVLKQLNVFLCEVFPKEGANKQVISSQADSLIKISRIWADFFPANTSNQPI
ncbi:hypothetical protein ACYCJE_14980 [Klebsiella pneumoniae]